PDLQVDVLAIHHHWREDQSYAELLELHGDGGVRRGRLGNWIRELSAGEELRIRAARGHKVRLRERSQEVALREGVNESRIITVAGSQKDVPPEEREVWTSLTGDDSPSAYGSNRSGWKTEGQTWERRPLERRA